MIARVNGYAIARVNVLVTCCDLAIASEATQVGPRVGSVDPGFGPAFLACVVGETKARDVVPLSAPLGPADGNSIRFRAPGNRPVRRFGVPKFSSATQDCLCYTSLTSRRSSSLAHVAGLASKRSAAVCLGAATSSSARSSAQRRCRGAG